MTQRRALLAALLAAPSIARADAENSFARVRARRQVLMGVDVEDTGFCLRDADGQLDGYLVALGQGLAQGLGVQPVFVKTTPGARMAELRDRRFDILLSAPPLVPEAMRLGMFASAVADLDWRLLLPSELVRAGLQGVRGLRLAVPAGITRVWLARLLAWMGVEFLPVTHWQIALAHLRAGECQGVIAADLAAEQLRRHMPKLSEGVSLPPTLMAPALRWGEHDLLRAVEMQLYLLRQRGVLNVLARHYLGRAVPREGQE